jgi:hypothetical protein
MASKFGAVLVLFALCIMTSNASTPDQHVPTVADASLNDFEPEAVFQALVMGLGAVAFFSVPFVGLNLLSCLILYPSIGFYDVDTCVITLDSNEAILSSVISVISIYSMMYYFYEIVWRIY